MTTCNEEETTSNSSQNSASVVSQTVNVDDLSFENPFSEYIGVSTNKKYLRINFGFFPDNTSYYSASNNETVYITFDDQGNSTSVTASDEDTVSCHSYCVTIPCSFTSSVPEGVNTQISVDPNDSQEECESYFFEFDYFSVNGYVVPLESKYTEFSVDFGFDITADGFTDTSDDSSISSSPGKLEDVYNAVVERQSGM